MFSIIAWVVIATIWFCIGSNNFKHKSVSGSLFQSTWFALMVALMYIIMEKVM